MKTLYKYILASTLLLNMLACKHQQTVTKSKDPSSTKPEKTSNSLKKQYAIKLGVNESDIKNEMLYQFINEWQGVPYKYAGKDKAVLFIKKYLDIPKEVSEYLLIKNARRRLKEWKEEGDFH